ncbi:MULTISPECIES: Arc family DNA-binding protein [Yersinia pseudotuberculosis complex]|nr:MULTISPECIES: Arc family DNA-binding protein [Yersinia pseudotuberculosis complex]ABS49272.1 putative transcriptional regulator [Yersinia pseudotuberculosis IP 31758]MCE4113783.1 Arc family DNA-binding protein [Yersinia pseudotuberculosis]MCF1165027.1 Arc family DNA-binding protein [Yersinia pseudotuberculosis]RYC28108.1 Arc family DNA-binding protein [Yersinia pseudotuberculosis]WLF02194.1 Arc family DNA-binding protein [Yersinia pseudotuberculosis]
MSDKPVSAQDKFMLRLPDGMREAIGERAKQNGRSMNSEIVQILQDAIDGEKNLTDLSLLIEKIPSNANSDEITEVFRKLVDQQNELLKKFLEQNNVMRVMLKEANKS